MSTNAFKVIDRYTSVVKTYPSIDPIAAPPPPPDINYILCVTFITASVT